MKKQKKIIILLLVVLGLGRYVYVFNQQYFFNPFSFKQDHITPQPFKYYKSPMGARVLSYKSSGLKEELITDQQRVLFIYRQLKQGEVLSSEDIEEMGGNLGSPTGNIHIGNLITVNGEIQGISAVTQVGFYGENYEFFRVTAIDQIYYGKSTDELRRFLKSTFEE